MLHAQVRENWTKPQAWRSRPALCRRAIPLDERETERGMRAIPWPGAETGGDLPLTQGNPLNFMGVTGVAVTGVFMRNPTLRSFPRKREPRSHSQASKPGSRGRAGVERTER